MNFITILYDERQHDDLFTKLKIFFGGDTKHVEVFELVPDEYIKVEWTSSQDPIDLATELSKTLENVVIETESNNGIDPFSRFINGAQLW